MASAQSPYFDTEVKGGVLLVRLQVPEIRHPTPAREFGDDVFALLVRDGHKDILLDLDPVRYMSSTGFATLMSIHKRVDEAGGRLKICGIHPDVQVGANIIGLGRLIETYADEDEAIESF